MRIRALLVERSRVAADLANVEKGKRDLQVLVAKRRITRHRAEIVLAHCAEEVKRLTERLADIDANLLLLRADAGAWPHTRTLVRSGIAFAAASSVIRSIFLDR